MNIIVAEPEISQGQRAEPTPKEPNTELQLTRG
jgi:hypothetical protein